MAIWQFNIYFIPKRSLIKKYGHIPEQLKILRDNEPSTSDEEDALSVPWWRDLNLNVKALQPIAQKFRDPETNDVFVGANENNIVEELSCRIDLREMNKEFIQTILSLANQFDCVLMDVRGHLFPAEIGALNDVLHLSNAYKFVTNPGEFLDDLSNGVIKPE